MKTLNAQSNLKMQTKVTQHLLQDSAFTSKCTMVVLKL